MEGVYTLIYLAIGAVLFFVYKKIYDYQFVQNNQYHEHTAYDSDNWVAIGVLVTVFWLIIIVDYAFFKSIKLFGNLIGDIIVFFMKRFSLYKSNKQ